MPATPETGGAGAEGDPQLLSLLMPLHYFYAQDGARLPEFRLLPGAELPEPQRSLLFHDSDMTSTLRRHHGTSLDLDVISAEISETYLLRMVILRRAEDSAPVEFGAIGIRLEAFDEPLRGEIARGSGPLGGLLQKHGADYLSAPKAYFSVVADHRIATALSEQEGAILYGRCNSLTDADGIVFADIVEVLPR